MNWLDVNENELNEAVEKEPTGFELPEAGVYEVRVNNCYIETGVDSASGKKNDWFNLETETKDGNKINLRWWFRYTGNSKNAKGNLAFGIVQAGKVFKAANLNLMNVKPKQINIEKFNKQIEALQLSDILGKKLVIGIRHRISGQYTNIDFVKACKVGDQECIDKLKDDIEKKPVIEDKPKEETKPKEESPAW